jgi:hypothetical protein
LAVQGFTCILRRVPGLMEKILTATPINIPNTMAIKGSGTARSRVMEAHTRPMKTVPSRQIEKNRPQLSLYIRFGAVSQLSPSYPGQHLHLPSRWLHLPLPLQQDVSVDAEGATKGNLDFKRLTNKPAVTGAAALATVIFIKTCFTVAFSRESFATAVA